MFALFVLLRETTHVPWPYQLAETLTYSEEVAACAAAASVSLAAAAILLILETACWRGQRR